MSQSELGALIGVGKTSICNYESGYSSPRNDILIKICRVFDVNKDFLLGISDIETRFIQYNESKIIPLYDSTNITALKSGEKSEAISHIQVPESIELRKGDFIALTATDDAVNKCGISKNDTVIVKKYIPNKPFPFEKICAVLVENKIYLRILSDGPDGMCLNVRTDDKTLKPVLVHPDTKVEIIGTVVQAIVTIK